MLRALVLASLAMLPSLRAAGRPNLIFILADDLGYAELGCYGQKVIHTPNLDRMAAEGMTFTQFYAGATVCAPSRSVLMTGQHQGHTRIRGNSPDSHAAAAALQKEDTTIARVLQSEGYTTAMIGKWGLGSTGDASTGLPANQGFDEFFGFLDHVHAHNHYPDHLWRNETRVPLPNIVTPVGERGGGYAKDGILYADDLGTDEALKFVSRHHPGPFFLYWSFIMPHANNERNRALHNGAEVPDFGPYAGEDWPEPDKGQAAMITRLDGYVGRILDKLDELGIAGETLVIFSSDNGPHNESSHNLARFQPAGPLRGIKRDLTDGGIRVPAIARWPGKIAAGSASGHVAYFGDFFATACEVAGAEVPAGLDSVSFAPTLLGTPEKQLKHEFLYWEFHEGGFHQAVLHQGRWKGIRSKSIRNPIVLHDLAADLGESRDLASEHPEIVEKIKSYLDGARTDAADWPVR
ncbi:arylsulfatase [Luteolibacter marinus]|uniref:arylsulfatase n=1 Tax=Luteolibacter marinus TaxID=2776705 RepID=UPI001D012968|nr:arylsulfatase [Luteolibacter marinus]